MSTNKSPTDPPDGNSNDKNKTKSGARRSSHVGGKRRAKPRRNQRVIVRGVRRSEPDLRRLARALIALAEQELAAEEQADARGVEQPGGRSAPTDRSSRGQVDEGEAA